MERLKLRHDEFKRAVQTLRDILNENFSIIVRDATIQRFEYTFETFWKYIREYLREKEGIACNSPKGCFRELFSAGSSIIDEEQTNKLLEMVDNRNMTSHTYKEEVARILYQKIGEYCSLMEKVLSKSENV